VTDFIIANAELNLYCPANNNNNDNNDNKAILNAESQVPGQPVGFLTFRHL